MKRSEWLCGMPHSGGNNSRLAYSSIDSAALNTQRVWAIDQLAALIKNTAVPRDDSLIELILELFVVHGFFTVSKSSKSPIRSVRYLSNISQAILMRKPPSRCVTLPNSLSLPTQSIPVVNGCSAA